MEFTVMLIECTGMVGAGKTTTSTLIQDCLEKRGFVVFSLKAAIARCLERSRLGRLLCPHISSEAWRRRIVLAVYVYGLGPLYKYFFMCAHPQLGWQVYRSQWNRKLPLWHRRIILKMFFEVAAGCQFLRPRLRPHEVVVLSEGFVHRAVHLYAWEKGKLNPGVLMTYFRRLPPLDLVVLVQAPFRECLERARARGLPSRLKDKNKATIDQFLDKTGQIVQLASMFLSSSSRRMIQIDNEGPLEYVATSLDERLDAFLRQVSDAGPDPRETVSACETTEQLRV